MGDCCADLASVNALARAHLDARHLGTPLRLVNASRELQELLAFVGLDDVLFGRRERQAEQREQALGVQKRSEPDDPPV